MGIGGDSSVATWLGGLLLVGSGITSAAYANAYCQAFDDNPKTPKSQNDTFYTAQYVRVLGALTAGLAFLYVAWTFVDSRHPAKTRLWSFSSERLQKARLQAKRSHMKKLAVVEAIIAILWIPPGAIFAFRGWLYKRKTTNNLSALTICSPRAIANCEALKGVGISTLVTVVIVLLLFVVTLIPCSVKPGAKSPEDVKKEEEAKEAEEDRLAGNRVRRAFGLPELSEAEYAEMKKSGNPNPRQCWGFNGFAGGNQGGGYYSGGMAAGMSGMGGFGSFAGGGPPWGGGWGNTGGGWGNNSGGWMNGAGSPIVLGGGGGSGLAGGGMQQSGNSANYIDVNIPLKQVFSNQTRNNQRRRFRPARRAYRPVPISITNYNPVTTASSSSAHSAGRAAAYSSSFRSAGSASARPSRSTGRPNPPPSTHTRSSSRHPVPSLLQTSGVSGALVRTRGR